MIQHKINIKPKEIEEGTIRSKMKLGNIQSINNKDKFNIDIQSSRTSLGSSGNTNNNRFLGSSVDYAKGLLKGSTIVGASSLILDAQKDPYKTLSEKILEKALAAAAGALTGAAILFVLPVPGSRVLAAGVLLISVLGGSAASNAISGIFTANRTNRQNEFAQRNRQFQAQLKGVPIVGQF